MAKEFKKGQEVTIIRKWSKDCTVYSQKAIVYSCGNKQMVLTCAETGVELGRNFKPTHAQWGAEIVIDGHEDSKIERASIEVSAELIRLELLHYNKITTSEYWTSGKSAPAYMRAIEKGFAEAKNFTPKFIVRTGK